MSQRKIPPNQFGRKSYHKNQEFMMDQSLFGSPSFCFLFSNLENCFLKIVFEKLIGKDNFTHFLFGACFLIQLFFCFPLHYYIFFPLNFFNKKKSQPPYFSCQHAWPHLISFFQKMPLNSFFLFFLFFFFILQVPKMAKCVFSFLFSIVEYGFSF